MGEGKYVFTTDVVFYGFVESFRLFTPQFIN